MPNTEGHKPSPYEHEDTSFSFSSAPDESDTDLRLSPNPYEEPMRLNLGIYIIGIYLIFSFTRLLGEYAGTLYELGLKQNIWTVDLSQTGILLYQIALTIKAITLILFIILAFRRSNSFKLKAICLLIFSALASGGCLFVASIYGLIPAGEAFGKLITFSVFSICISLYIGFSKRIREVFS